MSEQDQEFEFLVESRLTGFGVYLTEFSATETGYDLSYESIAADETGVIPHREVGRVVNVFRDVEPDPVDIEATVADLDGRQLGEWSVERDWLAALEADAMTEVEFSENVIEGIEPVESDSP